MEQLPPQVSQDSSRPCGRDAFGGRRDEHPTKWRKYLLLVQTGVCSLDWLEQEIRRYSAKDEGLLLADLERELRKDLREKQTALYVLKIVPRWQNRQLLNLRLSSVKELAGVSRFLSRAGPGDECWFCRTSMPAIGVSVAGRLAITAGGGQRHQVLEQVWHCSPRLIESYEPGFAFPYLRASRSSWGRRYLVEELHAPQPSSESAESLLADFLRVAREIEVARPRIEGLCEYLEERGCLVYSLEYKLSEGRLRVIDWDTENDWAVLERL